MDFDSFSSRTGTRKIQMAAPGTINDKITNCFWNLIVEHALDQRHNSWLVRLIYRYLHMPLDEVPNNEFSRNKILKFLILDRASSWDFHYDLFEEIMFGIRYPDAASPGTRSTIAAKCNTELARAGCPYRFVNYRLTEISSNEEIDEINAAANVPDKFHGSREHIQSAIAALSHKPNPEYRNCIEESIHAVESALKVSTSIKTGGIKDALKSFCDQHGIHAALQQSILKLYGFTSDKQGLRHPLLDEKDNLSGADARMMLVTASAIVNWIVAKDAGLAS